MASKHYIALLRGVNVGKAKRVPMADLCKLVASLGFGHVKSVLNSGNVVFSGPPSPPARVAAAIEELLVLRLGVAARVIVLDKDELASVIAANTLVTAATTDQSRLLAFIFARPGMAEALAPLAEQEWSPGALALGERAAYVWCPDGVLESSVAAAVNKQLGDKTTSRNWNTICKLYALCCEPVEGKL